MKKIETTKEFLERHLELWKFKVCKRKKWNELVLSYKEKRGEVKIKLAEIINIFSDSDINAIRDKFEDYATKSKNRDNSFFELFDNKEHIEKVFEERYFNKTIENYKETYFYEKVKECHHAYLNNIKNFNNDVKKSFDKVGNWKRGEDTKL
ncbi:MAG: hypothetical protein GX780_05900, partial [Campylobacteraceae bacterium]|nr:hypothetical protein [Campylobacteraceae bacterium]